MGLSKKIAYRLQTLREAAGLSQQEVADRAGLSLSLVTKMEQGRKADPRASTILALAGALGVRPGQLIEDLLPPPEGVLPANGKKGKKWKKAQKRLAAVAPGDAAPEAAPASDGSPAAGGEPASAALAVVPGQDEVPRKKKKKKDK